MRNMNYFVLRVANSGIHKITSKYLNLRRRKFLFGERWCGAKTKYVRPPPNTHSATHKKHRVSSVECFKKYDNYTSAILEV